jgi:hypothetical protein
MVVMPLLNLLKPIRFFSSNERRIVTSVGSSPVLGRISKPLSMNDAVLIAVITSASAFIGAGLSFYLNKRHERIAEWRQKKLDHYKLLLTGISDLAVDGINKDEANKRLALAVNTIALVAPQSVIEAWMKFHDEIRHGNPNPSLENERKLLVELLLEIRKDVGLTSSDNPKTFKFKLIGASPKKSNKP